MNVAIVGSRTIEVNNNTIEELRGKLAIVANGRKIDFLVSGGAKGADELAYRLAKREGIFIKVLFPDWDRYGKSAGYIRNDAIVKESDVLIALWDGESRGTQNTIDTAKKFGKEIHIFYEE